MEVLEFERKLEEIDFKPGRVPSLGHAIIRFLKDAVRSDAKVDLKKLGWDLAKDINNRTNGTFTKKDVVKILKDELEKQNIVIVMEEEKSLTKPKATTAGPKDRKGEIFESLTPSLKGMVLDTKIRTGKKYKALLEEVSKEEAEIVLGLDKIDPADRADFLNDDMFINAIITAHHDKYSPIVLANALGKTRQRIVNIVKREKQKQTQEHENPGL